jgi:hypothetical protein
VTGTGVVVVGVVALGATGVVVVVAPGVVADVVEPPVDNAVPDCPHSSKPKDSAAAWASLSAWSSWVERASAEALSPEASALCC